MGRGLKCLTGKKYKLYTHGGGINLRLFLCAFLDHRGIAEQRKAGFAVCEYCFVGLTAGYSVVDPDANNPFDDLKGIQLHSRGKLSVFDSSGLICQLGKVYIIPLGVFTALPLGILYESLYAIRFPLPDFFPHLAGILP